ncbi:MAG: BT_3928 family protein [Rikenellaceae bacterium]
MINTAASEHSQQSLRLKIVSHIARLIVGVTFVFSGFVKAVDPWGTMIKMSEYLTIYHMEWFESLNTPFSIWLASAELMMGMMLTFKVRIRMVSIFALTSMSIFTVVSLLSATILPVDNCGCFGDAIRLSPWATFGKNMVLLPLTFIVWYRYRPDKVFAFNRLELFLAGLFFTSTVSLSAYCFYHLPLIDFRPYKIGVNLPEAIDEAYASFAPTTTTTLIYRNIKSGKLREFSLDDTRWQDESKWEWVDTKTEVVAENEYKYLIAEFTLFDREGKDKTGELLSQDGGLVMVCVTNSKYLTPKPLLAVSKYISDAEAAGKRVVLLTPELLSGDITMIERHEVESFNIDPSTLKTMIRANVGVVVLEDGVIVDKRSWRDLQ